MPFPSVTTLTSNAIASAALLQYERFVPVSIIPDGQDWSSRQQIQYAAILGLLRDDFLGLKDWQEQLMLYSHTNMTILYPAFLAIQPLIPLNRNILMKLMYNPVLGMTVGMSLLRIVGFEKAFSLPTEILEDNVALKGSVT